MNVLHVMMDSKQRMITVSNGVPVWAVTHLGQQVRLTQDFREEEDSVSFIYRAGRVGKLDAIQTDYKGGSVALVWFDELGGVVEIPFDHLEWVNSAVTYPQ